MFSNRSNFCLTLKNTVVDPADSQLTDLDTDPLQFVDLLSENQSTLVSYRFSLKLRQCTARLGHQQTIGQQFDFPFRIQFDFREYTDGSVIDFFWYFIFHNVFAHNIN